MDTQNLQIFVEVMKRGSFAAVARELDVVPSTVSRAITSLEEELGVRLLQRTTRKVKPTEAGQVYYQRIEPLIEELNQARSITRDLGDEVTGTLRLTTSVTFGNSVIVPLLPEFMAKYPKLDVYCDLTDAVVDIVDDGFDLAVRLGHLNDSGLIATRLTDMRYVITASPSYLAQYGRPEQPEDIQHHQCLVFPHTGLGTDWLFRDNNGEIKSITPNSRLQLTNALALKECARAGMGLVMCSEWTVTRELYEGSLVRVFQDYDTAMASFDSAAWLVYPSRQYLPLKVRVFIDFMKEKFVNCTLSECLIRGQKTMQAYSQADVETPALAEDH
ncbi:MAG: LysR family transcriptional regulator [Gammaproteobacteria bacterium]|nr:LysR family transcriptional regulator [Gammaproteobacteria bacterium]